MATAPDSVAIAAESEHDPISSEPLLPQIAISGAAPSHPACLFQKTRLSRKCEKRLTGNHPEDTVSMPITDLCLGSDSATTTVAATRSVFVGPYFVESLTFANSTVSNTNA